MDEAVYPDDAAAGAVISESKQNYISERDGSDADGDDAAAAAETDNGWDGQIKLFFDRQTPEGADGTEPAMVKDEEVAEKKRKSEDGVSADCGVPVIKPAEEIARKQDEKVKGQIRKTRRIAKARRFTVPAVSFSRNRIVMMRYALSMKNMHMPNAPASRIG